MDSDALGPDDDPWAIVGVAESSTTDEIRRAYRIRARKLHPDVGGDAAAFRKLVAAFELLLRRSQRGQSTTSGEARTRARERANRQWDDVR